MASASAGDVIPRAGLCFGKLPWSVRLASGTDGRANPLDRLGVHPKRPSASASGAPDGKADQPDNNTGLANHSTFVLALFFHLTHRTARRTSPMNPRMTHTDMQGMVA